MQSLAWGTIARATECEFSVATPLDMTTSSYICLEVENARQTNARAIRWDIIVILVEHGLQWHDWVSPPSVGLNEAVPRYDES